MRALMRGLALALILIAAVQAIGAAQEDESRHKGFWFGFGGGWGSQDGSCDQCGSTDREGGFAGYFKLGTTLNPQWLVGIEGDSWFKHDGSIDTDEALGNLSAAVYFYPSVQGGFFVKAGVGAAGLRTSGPLPTIEGYGLGLVAGVGYDFAVAETISLTPVINFNYGSLGSLTADGVETATGATFNIVQIGLGVTIH